MGKRNRIKIDLHQKPAESPFATAKAYLDLYPTLKLRTLAAFSVSICSGTHRPKHGTGTQVKGAGIALTAPEAMKAPVSTLCGVRRRGPGALTVLMRTNNVANEVAANLERKRRKAQKWQRRQKHRRIKCKKWMTQLRLPWLRHTMT